MRADSQGITPEHLRNIGNLPSFTSPKTLPQSSKPKIIAKVTVSPAPDDEFVTPPPKQRRYLNPTPALQPSKLDSLMRELVLSDRMKTEPDYKKARADFLALIEEVLLRNPKIELDDKTYNKLAAELNKL